MWNYFAHSLIPNNTQYLNVIGVECDVLPNHLLCHILDSHEPYWCAFRLSSADLFSLSHSFCILSYDYSLPVDGSVVVLLLSFALIEVEVAAAEADVEEDVYLGQPWRVVAPNCCEFLLVYNGISRWAFDKAASLRINRALRNRSMVYIAKDYGSNVGKANAPGQVYKTHGNELFIIE